MNNDIKCKGIEKNTIKSLDISQRPREIIQQKGVESLSDEQLLAVLIDTGTKEENAIQIASKLIQYAGSLGELAKFDINMIRNVKGIGLAKACKIVASIELANRVAKTKAQIKNSINSPNDLIEIFSIEFDKLNVEVFKLVCLNTKNHIIHSQNITKGVVNGSVISTRELFKEAILRHAYSIIIMHNHPTGNPSPSKEDIEVTNKIKKAGEIMDIRLIDHIIYGNVESYFSFKENGYLN